MNFTQTLLDELIGCRKQITEPPKKDFAISLGMKRNGMRVMDSQGRLFLVYMRINEKFEENFSIGLKYLAPDGDGITLLRCNGPHGPFRDPRIVQPPWHAACHIHRATEENIAEHRKPESGGNITTAFASYRQALRFFLKTTNIAWDGTHFPGLEQPELFENDR